MTKNGLIGLSVGALALLGGLAVYTHNAFSEQLAEILESKELVNGELTLESQTSGFLSKTSQYKFTLLAEQLKKMNHSYHSNDDVELYINHHYQSFPLFVNSEITLDFTKGSAKDFMTAFPNQTIEHLLSINTNLLAQKHSSTLVIQPTHLINEEKTITVDMSQMQSNSVTDLTFKSGDVSIDMSNFNLDLGDVGILNIAGLKSVSTIVNLDGMMIAPRSTFSLDELSFVKPNSQENVSVNNFKAVSQYNNLDSDAINAQSTMTIDSINAQTLTSKYDVINTTLDISFDNFDKAGLVALDNIAKVSNDPSEILDAASKIFKRGFNGTIGKLDTTINELVLTTSGDFILPPYTGNNIQQDLLPHFMSEFGFNYSVNLGNNYADVFPQFAPMLDGMTTQGFILKEENGSLTTKFNMEKGAILANDQRIR